MQPASREEGWEKDPFSVNITPERIIARGVADNKGQTGIHLVTISELKNQEKLRYNVKILLEGDEESGSEGLERFLKENKEKLKADFILISDGELSLGYPTIELGFRGGFNCEIKLKTAETELHSGIYGGAVPSASFEALRLLSNLFVEEGQTILSSIREDLPEIPKELVEKNKEKINPEEIRKLATTKTLYLRDYDFYTTTGLFPAVIITGLEAGYTKEGFRNAVPPTATLKINFRLAPTQDPQKVIKELQEKVDQFVPPWVEKEVKTESPYKGVMLDKDNRFVERAANLLKEVFGAEPIYKYCGGGLPVVTHFHEILQIPQVLVPLANEDCRMHAVNENLKIDTVKKGIEFSLRFFSS